MPWDFSDKHSSHYPPPPKEEEAVIISWITVPLFSTIIYLQRSNNAQFKSREGCHLELTEGMIQS